MRFQCTFYKVSLICERYVIFITDVERIWSDIAFIRSNFPTLDVSFVSDDDLKNSFAKEKWRLFMISQEGLTDNFNMLCLLRSDCNEGYTEDNTIIVPRIQFLCVEIARNKECCNLAVCNEVPRY